MKYTAYVRNGSCRRIAQIFSPRHGGAIPLAKIWAPIRRHPLLFLLYFMLLFNSLAFAQNKSENIIRVRVLNDVNNIRLTLDSGYKVYSRDNKLLKEGKSLYKAKVTPISGGLLLGKSSVNSDAIRSEEHTSELQSR